MLGLHSARRYHVVRAGPFPGGFRVRLGVGLGGEEEEEDELWGIWSRGGRLLAEGREESARLEVETAFTHECAGGVQRW